MPLGLHQNLKSRLVEAIARGLPKIEIKNGMFLDHVSKFIAFYEAETALPDHGPIRDKLLTYVDEAPLTEFAGDVISTELLRLDRYSSEVPVQRLNEIAEYSDTNSVATSLVDQIDSLPWRYLFSLELPNDIAIYLNGIVSAERTLAPGVTIVASDSDLNSRLSLNCPDPKSHNRIHGGGLLFSAAKDIQWTDGGIVLQIEAEGFVGPYGGTVSNNIERKLKAFFGLCIALRMLQVETDYSSGEPRFGYYVHKFDGENWVIDNTINLNTDTSRVIKNLHLNTLITNAESEERRKSLGQLILTEIEAVFSAGAKSDTLLLAAQWLFDSYSRKDVLLNYVQAMVVIEILLGDKSISDELGLGQLLRNRCAYMVASSHSDRKRVLDDFDEIYRVRSQIVHRGKAYLTVKENTLYRKLQSFCNRVIQKEVDLLRADKKS